MIDYGAVYDKAANAVRPIDQAPEDEDWNQEHLDGIAAVVDAAKAEADAERYRLEVLISKAFVTTFNGGLDWEARVQKIRDILSEGIA